MGRLRHLTRWCFAGLTALVTVMIFTVNHGWARQNGITGQAVAGCTCHNTSPNTATTVSVVSGSGSFTVSPSSTTSFTITVAHASQSAAGVDIAVCTTAGGSTNAGTLSPASGSGLQSLASELTHSSPKTMTSGSASFAFTWQAPSTPGTYYMQAAGNAVNNDGTNGSDIWNYMTTQAITVLGVQVTAPNTAVSWCAGSTQSITWASGGVGNVKIELSSDGGSTFPTTLVASTSASSGSWSWAIPAGQTGGTSYRVRVTDVTNATVTDMSDANFTILVPPSISTPPSGTTLCLGQSLNLSVTATGSNPSYQWRKDGTGIPGANSATYSVASVTLGHAGTYDVVVTNSCSTVTSSTATVTVNAPPNISTHPQSVQKCLGESATFSVTASGAGIGYQWRKGGNNISGATSSSYTVSSITANDAGSYDVVVSGTCSPPATSNVANLVINTSPIINQSPTAATRCVGQSVTFTAAATGSNLTYQWRKNGAPIANATSTSYTINAVTPIDAGGYDVVVSGACPPTVTSGIAVLTVNNPPAITDPPESTEGCTGGKLVLTVGASGTQLTYQWRHNGFNINGATSTTLTINSLSPGDTGSYDVVVSGACSPPATSPAATVKLIIAPTIVNNPQNQSVVEGQNVTFSVSANGTDLRYEWRHGGTQLPNDTLSTLTIQNVKVSDAGNYTCRVYNSCNSMTSTAGQLSVTPAGSGPILAPVSSLVDFGAVHKGSKRDSTLTAFIKNSGDKPLTVNGMSIGGTGSNSFSILNQGTPFTLAPDETRNLELRYSPASSGTHTATLTFTSNSLGSPSVTLQGIGATASISLAQANLGSVAVGSQRDSTLRICNNGQLTYTVNNFVVQGSGFTLGQPTSSLPAVLKPNDCISVTVRFAPAAEGAASGSLLVVTGDNDSLSVSLSGSGALAGVEDEQAELASVRVAPNPMSDRAEIIINRMKAGQMDVLISDANGTIVKSFGRSTQSGEIHLYWNGVSDSGTLCANGVYRLVIRQHGKQQTLPLVLMR